MRCGKIRKLILTDHTDGELDGRLRKKVEEHINSCDRCREFEQNLKSAAVEPLRGAGYVRPPEAVWTRIRAGIEGREKESPLAEAMERLRDVFVVRKPAVVIASVMAVILVTGILASTVFIGRRAMNSYLEEQVDFLESLNNGNGYVYEDIGIPMEDIFL